jgi:hypothetical protein
MKSYPLVRGDVGSEHNLRTWHGRGHMILTAMLPGASLRDGKLK